MKILKKMVLDGVFRNPANQNADGSVNIDMEPLSHRAPLESTPKRRHSFDEADDRKRNNMENASKPAGQRKRSRSRSRRRYDEYVLCTLLCVGVNRS